MFWAFDIGAFDVGAFDAFYVSETCAAILMPGTFDTVEAIGVVGTFGTSAVGIKTFGPFWVG
eukprot:6243023-Ditylum_brightwellii.AAC.1